MPNSSFSPNPGQRRATELLTGPQRHTLLAGGARSGKTFLLTRATVVLTIGHLDHTPENCADDNLRAWCQRCHLTYDAKHHAQSSYVTRRKNKAIGELI